MSSHSPEKIGPGTWYSLHTICAEATTPKRKALAILFIEILSERFRCEICRRHFAQYVILDPPQQYVDEKEGLFLWSFRAHNNANLITGKREFSYEEAKSLYYGPGAVCNKKKQEAPPPLPEFGFRLVPI